MLSDENYQFLLQFKNASIRSDEFFDYEDEKLDWYIDQKLLQYHPSNHRVASYNGIIAVEHDNWVVITPDGLDALYSYEKRCDEQSKKERQRRFNNKISIASVLIPLITFIIGLIVERFSGILEIITNFFS